MEENTSRRTACAQFRAATQRMGDGIANAGLLGHHHYKLAAAARHM